jgi:D-apionolactonase
MTTLPLIYDGMGAPAPERIPLRAGALSMVYEGGMLRYIRYGDVEVLRGVYAAVRDHNWGTVPGVLRDVQMDVRDDSFDITFTSDHRQGDIHFVWRGAIHGTAQNEVTFSFDGEAKTAFRRNRIGFCVLHPAALTGSSCAIEHTNGMTETGKFPFEISPHQPYFDIRAIEHQPAQGVRFTVRMEGDTFEMEDQRNWTDASYKTYCTPLALPFPITVMTGEKVNQRISIQLSGDVQSASTAAHTNTLVAGNPDHPFKLPPLGLCLNTNVLSEREIRHLKALNLSHVRVDLRINNETESVLRHANEQASLIGVPLEIALHLGQNIQSDLERLSATVNAVKPNIARWFIFREGEVTTTDDTFRTALPVLRELGGEIGTGTDQFFTELNRHRPYTRDVDMLVYSVNPQVHAFDNASLIETLPIIKTTMRSARDFSYDAGIAVSPITFKMRHNPNATSAEAPPTEGELPNRVDVRQMSLFGAVWTLGAITSLAYGTVIAVPYADVSTATFYETVGWLGVMESESGSPLPDKFPSVASGVFPMYHVFADVGEFRGGTLIPLHASDPLRFDGCILSDGKRIRILIANYTHDPQTVTISGIDGQFELRSLDEHTADDAIRSPEAFRTTSGGRIELQKTGTEIILHPFAYVRLDEV